MVLKHCQPHSQSAYSTPKTFQRPSPLLKMFCHASERQEPSSHLQSSRHPKRKVRFPPSAPRRISLPAPTASTCCTILQLHSTASFDTSTSRAIASACIMLLLARASLGGQACVRSACITGPISQKCSMFTPRYPPSLHLVTHHGVGTDIGQRWL